MTLPTAACYGVILTISIVGIIYFVVMAFVNKFTGQLSDEDQLYLFDSQSEYETPPMQNSSKPTPEEIQKQKEEQKIQTQIRMETIRDILQTKYSNIYVQLDQCLMTVYLGTLIRAVIFTLVIWLIFISWFIYHDTYLQSFMATLFGLFASAIVSFISMKMSLSAIYRALIECKKGENYGYSSIAISSSAISTGIVALSIFFCVVIQPLNKYLYMGDGENPPEEPFDIAMAYDHIDSKDKINHLHFSYIGFSLAIATCNLFMRDVPNILGTGMIIGHDLVGKLKELSDDQHDNVENTLKKTTIISLILSQNMVSSADVLSSISITTIVINLLLTFTTLRASHLYGVFYFTQFLFAIMLIVCVIVQAMAFMFKKQDEKFDEHTIQHKKSIPSFVTGQIRLQLIIINSICFFVFLIVPLLYLPNGSFDILRDQPTYPVHFMNASPFAVVGCLELGLIGQTLILIISEYLTSHAFKYTQEAASQTIGSTSNGLMTVQRFATSLQISLISILAFLIFISYTQAGFFGVILLGLSFMITPSFFLAINLFSYICEEGQSICLYSHDLHRLITFRLSKMRWATLNYTIFLPLLNTSGMFIINIVMIGLFCVISKVSNIIIWDALVIFGFLVGSALAYFLKTQSVYSILSTQNQIQKDKEHANKAYENHDNKELQEKNVFKHTNPMDVMGDKIADVQTNIIVNILLCTISIVLVSWLLGERGLVGYISGMNLVAIHLIFLNIIKFHTAKNIREYNEQKINSQTLYKDEKGLDHTKKLAVSLTGSEADSLMNYILYNTLFILQGARILALGGYFGNFMEKNSVEISNSMFNSTIGSMIRGGHNLQQDVVQLEGQAERELEGHGGAAQPEGPDIDQLNQQLRELKQQDQTIIVRLQEDRQALRELQSDGYSQEAAIAIIERDLERQREDQAVIRAEMQQIMQQLSALNSGQPAAQSLLEIFWSI